MNYRSAGVRTNGGRRLRGPTKKHTDALLSAMTSSTTSSSSSTSSSLPTTSTSSLSSPSIPSQFETLLLPTRHTVAFGQQTPRFAARRRDLPGPGAYHKKKHHELLRHSTSLSSQGYGNGFVSRDHRFEMERTLHRQTKVPGPGEYDAGDFVRDRQRRTALNRATTSGAFAAPVMRRVAYTHVPPPGPGSYSPPPVISGVARDVPLGWKGASPGHIAGFDGIGRQFVKGGQTRARPVGGHDLLAAAASWPAPAAAGARRGRTSVKLAETGRGKGASATKTQSEVDKIARATAAATNVASTLSLRNNFGNTGIKPPFTTSAARFNTVTGGGTGLSVHEQRPGPGAHDPDAYTRLQNSRRGGAVSGIQSSAPRLVSTTTGAAAASDAIPGPGTYDIDTNATGLGVYVARDDELTHASRAFVVDHVVRSSTATTTPTTTRGTVPGPGTYDAKLPSCGAYSSGASLPPPLLPTMSTHSIGGGASAVAAATASSLALTSTSPPRVPAGLYRGGGASKRKVASPSGASSAFKATTMDQGMVSMGVGMNTFDARKRAVAVGMHVPGPAYYDAGVASQKVRAQRSFLLNQGSRWY
jgi:hypothetical protein